MTPWPVDLFKTILGQIGGTSDYGDSLTDTLRKIVVAEGGDARYQDGDGPVRLLKKWLDAIGGTSLENDTGEATLKKILAAYGGSPNYNRNMRQTAEAITGGSAGGGVAAPTNTVRPDVTGTPEVGEVLTCSAGTWTDSPSIAYQWRRDNVNIGGATASTHEIVEDDQGTLLSCYVTGTNGGGSLTVRATTDYPTIFVADGDSITAATGDDDWPEVLATALGAGWAITNVAVSAQTLDDMIADGVAQVDALVDPGSSVVLPWEFINQAGISNGAQIFGKLEDYIEAREAAGWLALWATTFHINAECQAANDLITAAHPTAIDLDRADLRADSVVFGDNIHLTEAGKAIVAGVVEDYLDENGFVGYLGGVPIPAAVSLENLKTYSNPTYVYDPVSPLDAPTLPHATTWLEVTSGPAGWDLVSTLVSGALENFPTGAPDFGQNLWALNTPQTTGGLSGGVYEIRDSA